MESSGVWKQLYTFPLFFAAFSLLGTICEAKKCDIDFHMETSSKMLMAGGNTTVLCDATCWDGEEPPEVVWKDERGNRIGNTPASVFSVSYNRGLMSRLVVLGASSDISGHYVCSVSRNGVLLQQKAVRVVVVGNELSPDIYRFRPDTGPRRGDMTPRHDFDYRPVRSVRQQRSKRYVNNHLTNHIVQEPETAEVGLEVPNNEANMINADMKDDIKPSQEFLPWNNFNDDNANYLDFNGENAKYLDQNEIIAENANHLDRNEYTDEHNINNMDQNAFINEITYKPDQNDAIDENTNFLTQSDFVDTPTDYNEKQKNENQNDAKDSVPDVFPSKVLDPFAIANTDEFDYRQNNEAYDNNNDDSLSMESLEYDPVMRAALDYLDNPQVKRADEVKKLKQLLEMFQDLHRDRRDTVGGQSSGDVTTDVKTSSTKMDFTATTPRSSTKTTSTTEYTSTPNRDNASRTTSESMDVSKTDLTPTNEQSSGSEEPAATKKQTTDAALQTKSASPFATNNAIKERQTSTERSRGGNGGGTYYSKEGILGGQNGQGTTTPTPCPEAPMFGKNGVLAFSITLAIAFLLFYAILMIIFLPRILARRASRRKSDLEAPIYRKKTSDAGDMAPLTIVSDDATSSDAKKDDDKQETTALNEAASSGEEKTEEAKKDTQDTTASVSTFLLRQSSQKKDDEEKAKDEAKDEKDEPKTDEEKKDSAPNAADSAPKDANQSEAAAGAKDAPDKKPEEASDQPNKAESAENQSDKEAAMKLQADDLLTSLNLSNDLFKGLDQSESSTGARESKTDVDADLPPPPPATDEFESKEGNDSNSTIDV